MWKCYWCKATFDTPDLQSYTENLDGENGYWTYHYAVCPQCGSDEVEEVEEEGDDW